MNRFSALCFVVLSAWSACAEQVQTVALDLIKPNNTFPLEFVEGTTPTVRALIRQNGTPYTGVSSWTGVLYYAAADDSATGVIVTNTSTGPDYVQWQLTRAQVATAGTYFVQFLFRGPAGLVQEWNRGELTIEDGGAAGPVLPWSPNYTGVYNRAEIDAIVSGLSNATLRADIDAASNRLDVVEPIVTDITSRVDVVETAILPLDRGVILTNQYSIPLVGATGTNGLVVVSRSRLSGNANPHIRMGLAGTPGNLEFYSGTNSDSEIAFYGGGGVNPYQKRLSLDGFGLLNLYGGTLTNGYLVGDWTLTGNLNLNGSGLTGIGSGPYLATSQAVVRLQASTSTWNAVSALTGRVADVEAAIGDMPDSGLVFSNQYSIPLLGATGAGGLVLVSSNRLAGYAAPHIRLGVGGGTTYGDAEIYAGTNYEAMIVFYAGNDLNLYRRRMSVDGFGNVDFYGGRLTNGYLAGNWTIDGNLNLSGHSISNVAEHTFYFTNGVSFSSLDVVNFKAATQAVVRIQASTNTWNSAATLAGTALQPAATNGTPEAIAALESYTSRVVTAEADIATLQTGRATRVSLYATNAALRAYVAASVAASTSGIPELVSAATANVATLQTGRVTLVQFYATNSALRAYAVAAATGATSGIPERVTAVEAYTSRVAAAEADIATLQTGRATRVELAATNAALRAYAAASAAGVTSGVPERITAVEGFTNEAHTAYGWGNHASAGYLTAATNTLLQLYVADSGVHGDNLTTNAAFTGSADGWSLVNAVYSANRIHCPFGQACTIAPTNGVTILPYRFYWVSFDRVTSSSDETITLTLGGDTETWTAGASATLTALMFATTNTPPELLVTPVSGAAYIDNFYVYEVTYGSVNAAAALSAPLIYLNGSNLIATIDAQASNIVASAEARLAVLETGSATVAGWQGSNAVLQAQITALGPAAVTTNQWQGSNAVLQAQINLRATAAQLAATNTALLAVIASETNRAQQAEVALAAYTNRAATALQPAATNDLNSRLVSAEGDIDVLETGTVSRASLTVSEGTSNAWDATSQTLVIRTNYAGAVQAAWTNIQDAGGYGLTNLDATVGLTFEGNVSRRLGWASGGFNFGGNMISNVGVARVTGLILRGGTQATGTVTSASSASSNSAVLATGKYVEEAIKGGRVRPSLYRYQACATAGQEVYVLASGEGITATILGTGITITIPSGVRLVSARVRWPGTSGTTITLDLGTADMANSGLADRWGCTAAVYREDTGAQILTAAAKLVVGTHDQVQVTGLHDTQVNHIVLHW